MKRERYTSGREKEILSGYIKSLALAPSLLCSEGKKMLHCLLTIKKIGILYNFLQAVHSPSTAATCAAPHKAGNSHFPRAALFE